MSDLADFSQCIVDSDSKEIGRARRLRGKALFASICLEATVVAVLLLSPLINPAVMTSQPILAPVPIFRSAPQPEPPRPQVVEHPVPTRQTSSVTFLQQPPRIPQHLLADGNNEPPPVYDTVGVAPTEGPGHGVGGDGSKPPHIARPDPARPVVMSGGVMEARLVNRVQPEYPQAAKVLHLSGVVQLRAIIGTDGAIRNLEVISGNPILVRAAVEAVQQWRYQPTRLSGKPVEVETVITVQFQMQ
ncbi:MAG TPA: TonB family protein [Candidatus Acidoferrum sp.]|nr:TonB family protein [Candidatus Acidoferrum sp.]